MTWTWIASLQLLALLFLVGEIFLPTFGILTLATLAALGGSLWLARDTGMAVWILASADLLIFPTLAWFLLSRIGPGPLGLSAQLAQGGAAAPSQDLCGRLGRTLTDLRPVGKARIGEECFEVVSAGAFLPADCEIVVIECGNNRVVVRAAPDPNPQTGA